MFSWQVTPKNVKLCALLTAVSAVLLLIGLRLLSALISGAIILLCIGLLIYTGMRWTKADLEAFPHRTRDFPTWFSLELLVSSLSPPDTGLSPEPSRIQGGKSGQRSGGRIQRVSAPGSGGRLCFWLICILRSESSPKPYHGYIRFRNPN